MTTRFENWIERDVFDHELEKVLDLRAREGWEFVAVVANSKKGFLIDETEIKYTIFFKRPLEDSKRLLNEGINTEHMGKW